MDRTWFERARFGLFVHYGLYSLLERGEWVMNREILSRSELDALAARFDPRAFDAGRLCDLAVESGMRYLVLTTMHHEGFRLYESELSDFNSKRACGRDLVAECVAAARARGLRIALYHSLNNWYDQPDAVAALEKPDAYETFVAATFARVRELVTRFNPVDVLWYDGWWPFNAEGWRAAEMNAMVRAIQPHILFNGRNGLPGDFATPEGHMTAPAPWRPWEACLCTNDHWGFHRGDHNWKRPGAIVDMLAVAATQRGNLLLNIGPRGDGSVPTEAIELLQTVGAWVQQHGECLFETDSFTFGLMQRGAHNGDWSPHGPITLKGKALYQWVRYWPGTALTLAGFDTRVRAVTLLGWTQPCAFDQEGGKVVVRGLPEAAPDPVCPVLRFDCEDVPRLYLTGGMRVPRVAHPPYDPCPSTIQGTPR